MALAIVVEDNRRERDQLVEYLRGLRFSVREFASVKSFTDSTIFSNKNEQLDPDLFILDRNLPLRDGERSHESQGTVLLSQVIEKFPGSIVAVLSGHLDYEHVDQAIQSANVIEIGQGEPLRTFVSCRKSNLDSFYDYLDRVSSTLNGIDNVGVEVLGDNSEVSVVSYRCLRRAAQYLNSVVVKARLLNEGYSDAEVWHCSFWGKDSLVANLIIKISNKESGSGGISNVVDAPFTTSRTFALKGLMSGRHVTAFNFAGDEAESLMSLIGSEPERAGEMAFRMLQHLSEVPSDPQSLSAREAVDPICEWDAIERACSDFSIAEPRPDRMVRLAMGKIHGDLHASNIFVNEERPILIDLEDVTGSKGVDVITLLISTLTHKSSPIAGVKWPSPAHIDAHFGTQGFGDGHESWGFFRHINDAIFGNGDGGKINSLEFWALALAYSSRQLRYHDVYNDPEKVDRLESIIVKSANILNV